MHDTPSASHQASVNRLCFSPNCSSSGTRTIAMVGRTSPTPSPVFSPEACVCLAHRYSVNPRLNPLHRHRCLSETCGSHVVSSRATPSSVHRASCRFKHCFEAKRGRCKYRRILRQSFCKLAPVKLQYFLPKRVLKQNTFRNQSIEIQELHHRLSIQMTSPLASTA
jgi:hypothetical protein